MSERERFEAWAYKHWRLCEIDISRCPHQLDEYSEPEIQDAWEAWQAACPKGWQCVPKKPTQYQQNAGSVERYHYKNDCRGIYGAMLSAAPNPEDAE